MGSAYGLQSPVLTYSPTLYVEATLPADGTLVLLDEADERAVYVVAGSVSIGSRRLRRRHAGGATPRNDCAVASQAETRVIVVGGAQLGPRHIWWNFVSSSEARIELAKRDWAEMRMGTVAGDDEFIPLPEA